MFQRLTVLVIVLGVVLLGVAGVGAGASNDWSPEPESLLTTTQQANLSYPVVDTGQATCYDDSGVIPCPGEGSAFYGQDSQYAGNTLSYTDNKDGTVTDNITGLVWQQSPDTDGDGDIDAADKMSYEAAGTYCENLSLGGYDDWQLPTIKQLYSLIDFSGVDPSGYEGSDTSGLVPFIDTETFDFAYGDTDANERIIDAQYASSTMYVGDTQVPLLFGVNLADGRIKGYGITLFGRDKTFLVACVRENSSYGVNDFSDNGDPSTPPRKRYSAGSGQAGTITDSATGLIWAQDDSGSDAPDGLNWEGALAYVQAQNDANYLGYNDWRLPNVKELQSIVDYGRSPDTTASAAIDPLFSATPITNEAGETDYGFYWSSTTHANWTDQPGRAGAYVSFGRAMGYMEGAWSDVHGAGAQRSDPKSGDPADWPTGNGPQGDAIRIYNHVRLVRDADTDSGTVTSPVSSPIVDTGQAACYDDDGAEITCPAEGKAFYGQDAQFAGTPADYTDNGDGTVTDNVTGLIWQQTPPATRYNWSGAAGYCSSLTLGGTTDWRLPDAKTLFSISDFSSGWPYLNTVYFDLSSQNVSKDEQYWSSNYYLAAATSAMSDTAFGINHGTGHIKAYPALVGGGPGLKTVRCVRGDEYIVNDFADNGDGTITDSATGLMWAQDDSGEGVDWESALAYADGFSLAGYDDWRVPNVKELQSIVDYSGVYPAIDQSYLPITDKDAYFWSSTSAYFSPATPGYYYAWYVAFGYAVGGDGEDVHGAGAVRFDTKAEGGPAGEDPERIYNHVRLVRDVDTDAGDRNYTVYVPIVIR